MRAGGKNAPSLSLPNSMPLATLLPLKLPPTILTTLQTQKSTKLASHTHTPKKEKKKRRNATHLTSSTQNSFSRVGMTANTASATSAARMFSKPNCLVARTGFRASVRAGSVSGVGRVVVVRSVCDHVLASV
jgi:hypothetical protein